MGGGPKYKGGFVETYALSCASSCIAEGVTYPFDITKTRLQIQGEAGTLSGGGAKRGIVGTLIGIVREEGITRVYRGLGRNLGCRCTSSGGVQGIRRSSSF